LALVPSIAAVFLLVGACNPPGPQTGEWITFGKPTSLFGADGLIIRVIESHRTNPNGTLDVRVEPPIQDDIPLGGPEPGTVGWRITLFNDLNGNGVYDPGEEIAQASGGVALGTDQPNPVAPPAVPPPWPDPLILDDVRGCKYMQIVQVRYVNGQPVRKTTTERVCTQTQPSGN